MLGVVDRLADAIVSVAAPMGTGPVTGTSLEAYWYAAGLRAGAAIGFLSAYARGSGPRRPSLGERGEEGAHGAQRRRRRTGAGVARARARRCPWLFCGPCSLSHVAAWPARLCRYLSPRQHVLEFFLFTALYVFFFRRASKGKVVVLRQGADTSYQFDKWDYLLRGTRARLVSARAPSL